MDATRDGEVLRWRVGEVEIIRVEEAVTPVPPAHLVPELTTGEIDACRPWVDRFVTGSGLLLLSVHTFVVRCGDRVIVVDTCAGLDPERPLPGDATFPARLAAVVDGGLDAVDAVLCTHLHFDHVGWNTVPDPSSPGGRRATFPNARYLFAAAELAAVDDDVREPAVQPLLDAGLVDLIDADRDQVLADGPAGTVRTTPTPGHTPGHVSVVIESAGDVAVITGDVYHSPVQLAFPDRAASFDDDPAAATATRRRLIERVADTDTLVLGTHFAPPTAGRVRRTSAGIVFVD